MRIAFLIRALNYGGAQRQLVALANGMQDRGHSVTVLVYYPGEPLEKDLSPQVSLFSIDKCGRWDFLRFIVRLVKEIRQAEPDVLHSYLGATNVIASLLKLFFPQLPIVWGVRSSFMDLSKYDWLSRVFHWLERFLGRFADLIIVNSHAGFDFATQNGFSHEKMKVIVNGIDTDRFRPDTQARHRIRTEWGVMTKEILIGGAGRLDPMKDIPTFLDAASMLAALHSEVRFVWVGDGPLDYRRDLQQISYMKGLEDKLIWAGTCEDMAAVYNAFDVFVSSSCGEGFSNVVGEAMACGIPCVVTDVGDSARIVGDTGWVVQQGDPRSLASAIEELLDNDNNVDHQRIRARVVSQFSLDVMIEKTEEALQSLL